MIYCSEQYAHIHQYDNYLRLDGDLGRYCFVTQEHTAISLPRSPIGGIQFGGYKEDDFIAEWAAIEKQLIDHGVENLLITIAPIFYDFSIPKEWLLNFGFQIEAEEISHFIPLFGELRPKTHKMEQRILQKKQAFIIEVEGTNSLEEVHEFLSRCRNTQGLEISIDLNTLKKSFKELPENYQIFTARLQGQLIGAVITVLVNEKVAYYFLPATDVQFRSMSPMVHLIQYMYDYYQEKGFKLIDLGISSENGVPQSSLITFKERMGGIRSSRYTFRKELKIS
jgi:hypothetical protein